jgi:hypothetical protein
MKLTTAAVALAIVLALGMAEIAVFSLMTGRSVAYIASLGLIPDEPHQDIN